MNWLQLVGIPALLAGLATGISSILLSAMRPHGGSTAPEYADSAAPKAAVYEVIETVTADPGRTKSADEVSPPNQAPIVLVVKDPAKAKRDFSPLITALIAALTGVTSAYIATRDPAPDCTAYALAVSDIADQHPTWTKEQIAQLMDTATLEHCGEPVVDVP